MLAKRHPCRFVMLNDLIGYLPMVKVLFTNKSHNSSPNTKNGLQPGLQSSSPVHTCMVVTIQCFPCQFDCLTFSPPPQRCFKSRLAFHKAFGGEKAAALPTTAAVELQRQRQKWKGEERRGAGTLVNIPSI